MPISRRTNLRVVADNKYAKLRQADTPEAFLARSLSIPDDRLEAFLTDAATGAFNSRPKADLSRLRRIELPSRRQMQNVERAADHLRARLAELDEDTKVQLDSLLLRSIVDEDGSSKGFLPALGRVSRSAGTMMPLIGSRPAWVRRWSRGLQGSSTEKEIIMPRKIPRNALIVVADGAGARFFRNVGQENEVSLSAEGEFTPSDLLDAGPAGKRPEESTHRETDEATFAKQLAKELYRRAHHGDFEALVLIADRQTLGQIRPILHKEVKDRLVSEIGKVLVRATISDIQKALN